MFDAPNTARRSLAVLVASVAALMTPTVADAGTYTAHTCHVPSGAAASGSGWAADRSPLTAVTATDNRCGSGGGLGASVASNVPPETVAHWTFRTPAGLALRGIAVHRSAVTSGGASGSRGVYGLYASDAAGRLTTLEGCNGAPCTLPPQASFGFAAPPASVRLQAWCYDSGGDAERCAGSGGLTAAFNLTRADLALEDPAPPVLTGVGGSLLAPGTRTGAQQVAIAAGDAGSGVRVLRVEADGKIVAATPVACSAPYADPKPCPATRSATLNVDASALGAGKHTIRVVATDASGNEAASKPQAITTDGVSLPKYRIEVSRSQSGKTARLADGASLTASYRKPPTLRGVLLDPSGKPAADTLVGLYSRVAGSSSQDRLSRSARTDASGAFEVEVARGPSRTLTLAALPGRSKAPSRGLGEARGTSKLTLRVRAAVSWSSRKRVRGGRRVAFSGRLLGGAIPTRGKRVSLQIRDRGKWRTVASRRTSRSGRFSMKLTTRPVGRTVRHSLRIRVGRESAYPFVAASSSTRSLTVTRSW